MNKRLRKEVEKLVVDTSVHLDMCAAALQAGSAQDFALFFKSARDAANLAKSKLCPEPIHGRN